MQTMPKDPTVRVLSCRKVRKCLPKRPTDAHKGMCGRLLLLCGSVGCTGAAAMAAQAALRSGAGLVYLGVPQSIYAIEAVKVTEPIVFPLPDVDGKLSSSVIPEISQRLNGMDAVLIGPGLGQSRGTEEVVCHVLKNFCGPVVLDADGINVMQAHKDILRGRTNPTILTPHPGEFARLWDQSDCSKVEGARSCAKDLNAIVVLKGHGTVITDGTVTYRNPTGNPGMAVGGSGDVLAGIITSFLGQGMRPMDAAACGVWIHGAAGDRCARELGVYGMLPTDMIRVLPQLLK